MKKESVVFLHGWQGDEATYGELPKILAKDGYNPKHVYLGKYITSWDDISLDDLAIACNDALLDAKILERGAFHCITHSTGALVIRNWVNRYYRLPHRKRKELPLRHLIMAAPANNGSRLASWGKKLPFDWGNRILKSLEIASPISWALNRAWMAEGYHKLPNFFPSLLVGGNNDQDLPWYAEAADKLLDKFGLDMPVFEEEGSDNTVRGCAANLNMSYHLFEPGATEPAFGHEMSGIPTWYFPKYSHAGKNQGILRSIRSVEHPVAKTVLEILRVDSKRHPAFAKQPAALPPEYQYSMVNVRVVDQFFNPVPEAMIWPYADPKDAIRVCHTHDGGDIVSFYVQRKLGMRLFGIVVEAPKRAGPLAGDLRWEYQKSETLSLYEADKRDLIPVGQTTFIEVILKKKLGDKVLKLRSLA